MWSSRPRASRGCSIPTQGQWRAFGLGVSKEYEGFPALPAVPRELHSIIRDDVSSGPQGVLPGVIRLDEQFTRKAMIDGLREGYPVVHIASHFSFNAGEGGDVLPAAWGRQLPEPRGDAEFPGHLRDGSSC